MSSLSDAGEFCRSVRGDDKTDSGGEGGYLGSAIFLLTPISSSGMRGGKVVDGCVGEGGMVW
jgi:hypothetical protein